jgi:hypothetical protein
LLCCPWMNSWKCCRYPPPHDVDALNSYDSFLKYSKIFLLAIIIEWKQMYQY